MFGGKGKGLELLKNAGLPVPDFIVLPHARVIEILNSDVEQDKVLSQIRKIADGTVAVRSSADIEDGATDSFAGVFKTVLDVPVEKIKIIEAIKAVFDSAKNSEILGQSGAQMNVIIQRYVKPVVAGVCFSNVYNNKGAEECLISFVRGMGEQLVDGTTKSFDIYLPWVDEKICANSFRFSGPEKLEYLDKIYSLIPHIQKICDDIYNFADIEWCIDADGNVWILQLRPITRNILLGSGRNFSFNVLSPGKANGKAFKIKVNDKHTKEEVEKYVTEFPTGAVMVSWWTDTNFLSALVRASAIVMRVGSLMSHGAIIAREKNIPCILVDRKIWEEIETGADIEIDTYSGMLRVNGKEFGTTNIGVKDMIGDLQLFDNVYEIFGKKFTSWFEWTDNGLVLRYNTNDDGADPKEIEKIDIFLRKSFGVVPMHSKDKYFNYFMIKRWKMLPVFSKFYDGMRGAIKNFDVADVRKFYDDTLNAVAELHARRENADDLEKLYCTEEILGINNMRNDLFPDFAFRFIYQYMFPYLRAFGKSFDDFIKKDFKSENSALMKIRDCLDAVAESRNSAWAELLKREIIRYSEWGELDAATTKYFGVENTKYNVHKCIVTLSCKEYPKLLTGRDEILNELWYNNVMNHKPESE